MSDEPFDKYWPCLKKHQKRTRHWLPYIRESANHVSNRPFRYFTLCARPMIDIYMLVREGILDYDEKSRRVAGAFFCECVTAIIGEMRELIGAEEAGFCGLLEDLVLFNDTPNTLPYPDEQAISEYISKEGDSIPPSVRDELEKKRAHLSFRGQFPFDFLNLDYCDPYYGKPPNVLRVHEAVKTILEWQTHEGHPLDAAPFSVDRFTVAITCQTDTMLDASAKERLKEIVSANRSDHDNYRESLDAAGKTDIEAWQRTDELDFFMAAWPKEIARIANELGWDISIKNHCFYQRTGDSGRRYHMVCLVAEFERAITCTTYLSTAIECLDPDQRHEIRSISPTSVEGTELLEDLREIVSLRNEQAEAHHVTKLADPGEELNRFSQEGIRY